MWCAVDGWFARYFRYLIPTPYPSASGLGSEKPMTLTGPR